jgi:hypothetical protein
VAKDYAKLWHPEVYRLKAAVETVCAPRRVDPDDSDSLRRAAAEDGAIWLPGLIPPADVAPLADLVHALLREMAWIGDENRALAPTPAYDAPEFVLLQQRAFPSPDFDRLRRHPRLIDVLTSVLGGPAEPILGDLVRVMSPGEPPRGTLPHQDTFYVKNKPVLWTAWLPLAPVPLTLGPIAAWPGSHELGELPHRGNGAGSQGFVVPEAARWVAADMVPGDVCLFEGRTIHRSLPNNSAATMRISVDFRYAPGFDRPVHPA